MTRLQLIIPLILWVAWLNNAAAAHGWQLTGPATGAAIYFAALLLIVLRVRLISRRAMRRHPASASTAIGRVHQIVFAVRWLVLGLHAFALFYLGFGRFVIRWMPPITDSIETLAAFASLMPVAATWLGLVWAQYPLDRAVREKNAMYSFEFGEPIYPIPSFTQHILAAFRLQILFTLVPVLAIGLVRDVAGLILNHYGSATGGTADAVMTLTATGGVFLLSPELLRRVLPTQPLPSSELRERLEALCDRLHLRYREILLWRTHHTLDNAAVMGIVPQVRYILLSDLLISTMTQEQIEAVFAHEAGHVKHRHMTWYLIFFVTLVLALGTTGGAIERWPAMSGVLASVDIETLTTVIGILSFFVLFGALSRNMERQADVFAARTMSIQPMAAGPIGAGNTNAVGRDGVAMFCSALAKVACVNNIPLDGGSIAFGQSWPRQLYTRLVNHSANWLHGSIRSRLDYLQTLIDAPDRLARFDRKMILVRTALLAALAITVAWTINSSSR